MVPECGSRFYQEDTSRFPSSIRIRCRRRLQHRFARLGHWNNLQLVPGQLLREHIINPLDMQNTGSYPPDIAYHQRLANGTITATPYSASPTKPGSLSTQTRNITPPCSTTISRSCWLWFMGPRIHVLRCRFSDPRL